MGWTRWLVLAATLLVAGSPALAGTTAGKVVRVSGAQVTISVGSTAGVREGFTGEVFYVLDIAGQKKRITVAQFAVQKVDTKTTVVRVFNTTAPVNTGYLITFNQTLSPQKVRVGPAPKGNVYVSSEPEGATVFVNGKRHGSPTPTLIEGVPVGEARIELKKDFYFGTAVVQVSEGQLSKATVELKAEPAEVRLLSSPFEAKVFIDDVFKGTTPVFIKDMQAGRHQIRMEKEHHFPADETLFIKGGSKEEITLTLKPFGMLALYYQPADAELAIDGEEFACTGGRCELKLPTGPHEILLTRDSYLKHGQEVRVDTGKTARLDVAMRGYPAVAFTSEPDKVYVSLQGNSLGRTPLDLQFPDEGEYEFEFTKDQYAPVKKKVRLAAGHKESAEVVLLPLPRVVITTDPTEAEVFLSDKAMGTTPLTITLDEPGTYVFTLKKELYRTAEVRAQVDLGDVATFNEALEYQADVAMQLARQAEYERVVRMKKILGWTFTGVGTASLAGSVPFYIFWTGKTQDADSEYDKYKKLDAGTAQDVFDSTYDNVQANARSATTNFAVAVSLTAVGLASTAYGLYELLTIPKSSPTGGDDEAPAADEPESALFWTPFATDTAAGFVVGGSF